MKAKIYRYQGCWILEISSSLGPIRGATFKFASWLDAVAKSEALRQIAADHGEDHLLAEMRLFPRAHGASHLRHP